MGPTFQVTPVPSVFAAGAPNAYFKPGDPVIRMVPWAKGGVGEVMCDMYWSDGSPQEAAPRRVLSQQLSQLQEHGYELLSALESEFQLCHKDTQLPVTEGNEHCHMACLADYEGLICDLTTELQKVDVTLETCNLEWSPGQIEVTFRPEWGMATTDNYMRFKDAARALSDRYGFVPTFMTRPFAVHGASNGLHFNHSLWDAERRTNVLYSAESASGLSDTGRYWVGGLLEHADALTALCSPTVNCYRRLHTPWTPDRKDWGLENRCTAFRVAKDRGCRIENRLVSGSANVYLAAAGTIAAGLDGIKNKIEPPAPGVNPEAGEIPHSLDQALTALGQDRVIVAELGAEFLEWFNLAKQYEQEEFKDHDIKKDAPAELAQERKYFFKL